MTFSFYLFSYHIQDLLLNWESLQFHWTDIWNLTHVIPEVPIFDISDALQHPQSASRTLRVISSKVIWMSIGRVYSAYNSPNKELMFGDFLLSEHLQINISQLSGITWLSISGWPYQSESSVCFSWLQIPFLEGFEFYGPFFYSPSSITSQNKW